MATYPTLEVLLEQPDKKNFLQVKRSMRSVLSSLLVCLMAVAAVFLVLLFSPTGQVPERIPLLGGISLKWLWIIPALFALEILRKRHDDLYIFGLNNVTQKSGRLSLNYHAPMLKYTDIREIAVAQDIFGRIFNYGNVELATAAQSGNEMVIEGIVSPTDLAALIEDIRLYNLEHPNEAVVEETTQAPPTSVIASGV